MKAKFNWVDALIILVLIVAVLGGTYFLKGTGESATEAKNITAEAVLLMTEVEKDVADTVSVGDKVFVGEKTRSRMEVTAVEVGPAKKMGDDIVGGMIRESEVPDRYDVKITMRGVGTESQNAVEVSGNALRVGEKVIAKSKNWAEEGYIIDLDIIEE